MSDPWKYIWDTIGWAINTGDENHRTLAAGLGTAVEGHGPEHEERIGYPICWACTEDFDVTPTEHPCYAVTETAKAMGWKESLPCEACGSDGELEKLRAAIERVRNLCEHGWDLPPGGTYSELVDDRIVRVEYVLRNLEGDRSRDD